MVIRTDVKSPLHATVSTTETDYWNDSCSLEELSYAIEHGATGATSNPTIVGEVLQKEMTLWRDRIGGLIAAGPRAAEGEGTGRRIEEKGGEGGGRLRREGRPSL